MSKRGFMFFVIASAAGVVAGNFGNDGIRWLVADVFNRPSLVKPATYLVIAIGGFATLLSYRSYKAYCRRQADQSNQPPRKEG